MVVSNIEDSLFVVHNIKIYSIMVGRQQCLKLFFTI